MVKGSPKVKKDPKVVVFGTEVGEDNKPEEKIEREFRFHRRHGSLTWGLFFIVIGVLFLLSNFGTLPPIVWSQVARLWPILIILIGVETLFGQSDASDFVSSLIGIFIFGTILGVVFLQFAPHLVAGLPDGVVNYFQSISNYLQLK